MIAQHILFFVALSLACQLLYAFSVDDAFNLSEVTDGIYVHFGKHASITAKQHDDIANIGFIVGDKCIAVIDTGGSLATGKALLRAIRSVSSRPICYVINTHIHFDHILGNLAFVDEQPIFVGHYDLAHAVEQNREFFLAQFKSNLGDDPDSTSIIAPSVLVSDPFELDLGNRVLMLISYPVAHSHTDLVVMDKQTKTLWSGDLIFRERTPALTGSLKGWLAAMNDMQQYDISLVIPGHGSMAPSITEALSAQKSYLTLLLESTRKAISAGLFVNEAIEANEKGNQQGWLLYQDQHPANVSRAYSELEWE